MRAASALALPFLAALVLAAVPGAAHAQGCQLRIEGLSRIAFVQGYDPLSGREAEERVDVTVRRLSGDCDFALGAGPGQGGGATRRMSQGGSGLAYEIYGGRGRGRPLRDADTGGTDVLVLGEFRGNQVEARLDLTAIVPEGQVVTAGGYSDTVVFTLYQLVGGVPGRVLDSRAVSVSATVSAVASFEVVIDGSRTALRGGTLGKLDFGTLSAGQRRGFDLEARGNVGYDIELGSENGGAMVGQGYAKESSVPYRLYLDGRGLDLGRPAAVGQSPVTDTGRAATLHRFEIEIGDTGRAEAGKYRDDLTLTVTTR
jgi:spore coat protein U-like protein